MKWQAVVEVAWVDVVSVPVANAYVRNVGIEHHIHVANLATIRCARNVALK